ncbi:hypothetical protein MC885_019788, partial [Smutsia gigantea]
HFLLTQWGPCRWGSKLSLLLPAHASFTSQSPGKCLWSKKSCMLVKNSPLRLGEIRSLRQCQEHQGNLSGVLRGQDPGSLTSINFLLSLKMSWVRETAWRLTCRTAPPNRVGWVPNSQCSLKMPAFKDLKKKVLERVQLGLPSPVVPNGHRAIIDHSQFRRRFLPF